jgi:hypothetical protein
MDSIVEDYVDVIHSTLVHRAAYLSNLPEPRPSYETPDGEKLYFPGQALFEQLVWNIGVALSVNMLASYLYEKYFAKKDKNQILSIEQIKAIANEMSLIIHNSPEVAKLKQVKNNIDATRESEAFLECAHILVNHGWPEQDARTDIDKAIRETIEFWEERLS